MRVLRSALRWIFYVQAFVFIVGGANVAWRRFHGPTPLRLISVVVLSYLIVLGILSALSAWRIKRAGGWTQGLGLITSVMNLPLFPIGTVVGIAGVIYFVRERPPDLVPEREHTPIPGDGTSKSLSTVTCLAQIAWVWFVYGRIFDWAVQRGMPLHHLGLINWGLSLFLAIYAAVIFHELGHFAAGRTVRFRLFGFRLGCFDCFHSGGRWGVRLKRNNYMGGSVTMIPEHADNIRSRAMIMLFGGPLGSLVLGLTGAGLLLTVPVPVWPPAVGLFIVLATSMGIGDFLFNLVPLGTGTNYSDGAKILQLYRNGSWADYYCSVFYMNLSRTTSLRPRDWPTAAVERAAAFGASLPQPAGIFASAYAHYEDDGNVERAGYYLEQATAAADPGSATASNVAVERAYFEAYYHHDGSEGARWLAQVPKKNDSADYWRSTAAVLAAQGDLSGARSAWRSGWELVSKLPQAGIYEMDRRQFRMLDEWITELAGLDADAGNELQRRSEPVEETVQADS